MFDAHNSETYIRSSQGFVPDWGYDSIKEICSYCGTEKYIKNGKCLSCGAPFIAKKKRIVSGLVKMTPEEIRQKHIRKVLEQDAMEKEMEDETDGYPMYETRMGIIWWLKVIFNFIVSLIWHSLWYLILVKILLSSGLELEMSWSFAGLFYIFGGFQTVTWVFKTVFADLKKDFGLQFTYN